MINEKHIILFDGECNFCSFWVKYVIKRDKNDAFRFASLQSAIGKKYLNQFKVDDGIDSVVLIKNNAATTKSTAALQLFFLLGGIYACGIIFWVVPKFIRDGVYDIVAQNRKKLLKHESCIFPDETLKTKFLS